jgi:hypothetical protein
MRCGSAICLPRTSGKAATGGAVVSVSEHGRACVIPQAAHPAVHHSEELEVPPNIILRLLPPYSPELNPQENLWDEIREKIFKNYALKSMDEVYAKLEDAALYIERNPPLVKSITSFPYIAKSL